MKEASFNTRRDGNVVDCFLCAQLCRIPPGRRGKCGVRENRDGTLWSLVYGRLIAQHVDPIEKKPLFHFYPGTRTYSIATAGCNFRCLFCQNADISQAPRDSQVIFGEKVPPEAVVAQARRTGCASISYTYTEPTIFMEYALDVARLAVDAGLRNVFVSNGFMTPQSLEAVAPFLHAANVDLKAFSDSFYHDQCGGRLQPVLDTLQRMKALGIWVEVTTLLIPGLNDDPDELRELARFLVSLGPETPWHISRFHPQYRMLDRPITSVQTLRRAREIGREAGLWYVYTGNVPGDEGENTYCYKCGAMLVERYGFNGNAVGMRAGSCRHCGTPVAGIGMEG